jgi:hypothetical protein
MNNTELLNYDIQNLKSLLDQVQAMINVKNEQLKLMQNNPVVKQISNQSDESHPRHPRHHRRNIDEPRPRPKYIPK